MGRQTGDVPALSRAPRECPAPGLQIIARLYGVRFRFSREGRPCGSIDTGILPSCRANAACQDLAAAPQSCEGAVKKPVFDLRTRVTENILL
jgi:hypothetical protein